RLHPGDGDEARGRPGGLAMRVRKFVDEGFGNSAHLVISEREGVAALIDPLRDVDTYLDAAHADGVRITHVLETHLHNDFLSGGSLLVGAVSRTDLLGHEHATGLAHESTRRAWRTSSTARCTNASCAWMTTWSFIRPTARARSARRPQARSRRPPSAASAAAT